MIPTKTYPLSAIMGNEVTDKERIAELEAQLKYTEQHAADLEAENLEAEILALRKIAGLIGAIFVYGGFKAETYNERELKKLLRETGNFWKSVADYEAAITDRRQS